MGIKGFVRGVFKFECIPGLKIFAHGFSAFTGLALGIDIFAHGFNPIIERLGGLFSSKLITSVL